MPLVIFVLGEPAAGKSTCAKLIARRLGAAYIDKDTVVTGLTEAILILAGTDPHGRDENQYYQDHVMDLEYETILKVASDNLGVGLSVVLDAPFGRYLNVKDFVVDWSHTLSWGDDVSPVVVYVTATGEAIRQRMTRRAADRDAWKLANWDEYWRGLSWAKGVTCQWRGVTEIQLDNSGPAPDIDALLARLPAVIRRPPTPPG